MPNIVLFSNNEVFKSDIIDQIHLYAPEFNVLSNEVDTADIIIIDEDTKQLDVLCKKDIKTPIIFLSNDEIADNSRVFQITKPFNLNFNNLFFFFHHCLLSAK